MFKLYTQCACPGNYSSSQTECKATDMICVVVKCQMELVQLIFIPLIVQLIHLEMKQVQFN